MKTLLLKKTVDKSLLKAGLTIPVSLSAAFMQALGLTLKRGEKSQISIIVNEISYSAIFTHVDMKVADREIFQIRYSEGSPLGKHLRDVFVNPAEAREKQYVEIWSVADNTLEFKCFEQVPIIDDNMKRSFFEYLGDETSLCGYVKSYKLAFYMCYFSSDILAERIRTDVFTNRFLDFYRNRIKSGLKAETDSSSILFSPEMCSETEVYQLIINNPFKAISQKGFFNKEVIEGVEYFSISPNLYRELTMDDINTIRDIVSNKLALYYSKAASAKGKKKKPMEMKSSKKLKQKELHTLFISDLGPAVLKVDDLQKKPLIIELASPFLCKIKVYMFNCTCPPGGRKPDEFKSQLILDGQQRNERGYLDDTDGTFILLVGYAMPYGDQTNGVYVLWDAEEHRTFAYSANLQTKLDPILEAAYEDVVLQTKKSGEIVVLSSRKNLTAALTKRLQLYADRLLGEQ